jgi:hypothetical protein
MKKQILITIALLFLLVGGIALSSTITEILGTDTISSSRAVINTNFNNLNGDKIENSSLFTVSTSTSRVGIGTTTPAYTLDVNGQLRVIATTTLGTTTITKLTATNASTTALSITGLANGFLKVNGNGAISTSTIDLSNDTNLVAGRSLSTSTVGQIDADAELYTKSFSIPIKNSTTTSNPAAQHSPPIAITITKVKCSSSSGTTTIQFDERAETTQWTAGTDVLSAVLECGTTVASTTAFANAGIAANAWISLDIDAVAGGSTTTSINVSYTVND